MKRKLISLIICFAIVTSGVLAIAIYGMTDKNIYISTAEALVSAIEEAEDKTTIVIKNDIEINEELQINKELTINLNGNTISNTQSVWDTSSGNWSLISVKEGGNLTITGNGKIEALQDDCYAIDVRGGMVTIEGGTFIGNVTTVYVHDGLAVINGGTYDIKQLSSFNDNRYTLNCLDANLKNQTAQIRVTGGSFKNFDPSASDSENPIYNFVEEGYQSVLSGEYYTVSKIN